MNAVPLALGLGSIGAGALLMYGAVKNKPVIGADGLLTRVLTGKGIPPGAEPSGGGGGPSDGSASPGKGSRKVEHPGRIRHARPQSERPAGSGYDD